MSSAPSSPPGPSPEASSDKKQVGIADLEVVRADLVEKQHGAGSAQLEFDRLSAQLNAGDTSADAAQGKIIGAVQRLAQANAELAEAQAKFLEAEMEAYRQTMEKAEGQKPGEQPTPESHGGTAAPDPERELKEQQQRIDQALQEKFSDLLGARRENDRPDIAPVSPGALAALVNAP